MTDTFTLEAISQVLDAAAVEMFEGCCQSNASLHRIAGES